MKEGRPTEEEPSFGWLEGQAEAKRVTRRRRDLIVASYLVPCKPTKYYM